jgi:hypothetical protein
MKPFEGIFPAMITPFASGARDKARGRVPVVCEARPSANGGPSSREIPHG